MSVCKMQQAAGPAFLQQPADILVTCAIADAERTTVGALAWHTIAIAQYATNYSLH